MIEREITRDWMQIEITISIPVVQNSMNSVNKEGSGYARPLLLLLWIKGDRTFARIHIVGSVI